MTDSWSFPRSRFSERGGPERTLCPGREAQTPGKWVSVTHRGRIHKAEARDPDNKCGLLHHLGSKSKILFLFFSFYVYIFFLLNFFFYWRIIALQNFVIFCQTSTWISPRYTTQHLHKHWRTEFTKVWDSCVNHFPLCSGESTLINLINKTVNHNNSTQGVLI